MPTSPYYTVLLYSMIRCVALARQSVLLYRDIVCIMLIIKIMRHCEEVSDQFIGLLGNFPNNEIFGPQKILIPLHDQNCHFSVLMKEVALTVILEVVIHHLEMIQLHQLGLMVKNRLNDT